jgi:hypothetical protein
LILALLCGAVFVAVLVFRSLYSRYLRSSEDAWNRQNKAPGSADAETMIRCRQCEAYFPVSEAISGPSGLVFCCEDHRRHYFSAH